MAKQIVVLGKSTSGPYDNYQFAFWYPITSGALARTAGSVWPGASTSENTAIQNGSVLEEVESIQVPINTATATVKDLANKRWVTRNSEFNSIGPNQYNGVFFDSVSGWSA
jgi:hypothetical protein